MGYNRGSDRGHKDDADASTRNKGLNDYGYEILGNAEEI